MIQIFRKYMMDMSPDFQNSDDSTSKNDGEKLPIHLAAVSGDLAQLKQLIDHGAYIEAMDVRGNTALILACRRPGNLECVKLLLKNNANPNARNKGKRTALQEAALAGDAEILQLLIDKAAVVDVKDLWGETALILACGISGNIGCVRLLLGKNASPNILSKRRRTALQAAAMCGDVEVLKLLIDHGADAKAKDNDGNTALILACRKPGNLDCVKFLLSNYANSKSSRKCIDAALLEAASSGDAEILKFLIDHRADVDFRDRDGNTALILACGKTGNIECVRLLLASCANPNSHNNVKQTALQASAESGDAQVLKLLIDSGANIEASDIDGDTALVCACEKPGNIECVKLLLSSNASPDQHSNGVRTALQAAAEHGDVEILKLLIDRGADVEARDKDENTALILACKKSGNVECVRVLLSSNANPNAYNKYSVTALLESARAGDAKVLKLLIDYGADVEAMNEWGQKALILACEKSKDIECVKCLLANHADPNAENRKLETALQVAVITNQIENTKSLIRYGADLEYETPCEVTSYLLAARNMNFEIIELLHQAGVNTKVATKSGRNAIMVVLGEVWKRKRPFDETIKTILQSMVDNGVPVNHTDMNGTTALIEAAIQENVEVLQFLLNVNADVHVRRAMLSSVYGDTALAFLLSYGDCYNKRWLTCLKELVRCGALNSLSDPVYTLHMLIRRNRPEAISVLLSNGVAPAVCQSHRVHFTVSGMAIDSPLKLVLVNRYTELLRCFLKNLVLCPCDIGNHFYHLYRHELVSVQDFYSSCSEGSSEEDSLSERDTSEAKQNTEEIVRLMDGFYSQPLSLFTQSFVIVSNAVGGIPGRVERINSLPVPELIKDMLLFRNINISEDFNDIYSTDVIASYPGDGNSGFDSDWDAGFYTDSDD